MSHACSDGRCTVLCGSRRQRLSRCLRRGSSSKAEGGAGGEKGEECTHMHARTHTHTHTNKHKHIHARIHTHTHNTQPLTAVVMSLTLSPFAPCNRGKSVLHSSLSATIGVTRCTSHDTRHTSHVTRHMSHVTRHTYALQSTPPRSAPAPTTCCAFSRQPETLHVQWA